MTTLSRLGSPLHPADWVRGLAGPILDKELRVASRRRRNFVFRFAYLALLGVFVVIVWIESVGRFGPGAYVAMQMPLAGQEIVLTIVLFQFVMMQLAAVVMLSGAVSEEIYRRTLGVLMTTPITGFQIVVGKLLGSLLQMALLLAVSLPLLVLVRVFGGVPWEFVVAGLGITLASALFAASLSLYFSMGSRRAYWVVLETLVALSASSSRFPGSRLWRATGPSESSSARSWAGSTPMRPWPWRRSARVLRARAFRPPTGRSTAWRILAASALLVAASVIRVRRVALREISGEGRASRRAARSAAAGPIGVAAPVEMVRRVRGSPVAWRELRTHLMPSRRYAAWGTILVVGLMAVIYLSAGASIGTGDFQIGSALVLLALGLLATAVVAATGITSEKEAGSWPILLVTPLGRDHILLGKAVGVARRSLPVWALLGLHIVYCIGLGYMYPLVGLLLLVVSLGAAVFLTGSGLFFGAMCRRTTTAVILSLAMALAVWVAAPLVVVLAAEMAPVLRWFAPVPNEAELLARSRVVHPSDGPGGRAGGIPRPVADQPVAPQRMGHVQLAAARRHGRPRRDLTDCHGLGLAACVRGPGDRGAGERTDAAGDLAAPLAGRVLCARAGSCFRNGAKAWHPAYGCGSDIWNLRFEISNLR